MNCFIKTFLSMLIAACIYTTGSYAQSSGLFNFIRTVEVTPDAMYLTGSFARINYISAVDRFVVTFGSKASTEPGPCKGAGYAYKEYSLEMQETGINGLLTWNDKACEANDAGSIMDGNTYYFVQVPTDSGFPYGWRVTKFDASNWSRLKERIVFCEDTLESNTDPCVAFVNGQLDISDQYNPAGIWQLGFQSRHHFLSADLDSIDVRILDDSPTLSGASMIYVDNIYYLISANAYDGDLVVLKYDNLWNYIETIPLISEANWSQGVTFDGERFYIAYLDTRLRTDPDFFPVWNNVHLAAFDREWNLLDDVAVTSYDTTDHQQTGRPWVIRHGNRLYVSYDIDSIDAVTHEEMLRWQARVNIYELNPDFTSVEDRAGNFSGTALEQNCPNPFSDHTSITYTTPITERVSLKVFDADGRQVATLVNEKKQPGKYTVPLNTNDLPNGIYFYHLTCGNYSQTKKMILIK